MQKTLIGIGIVLIVLGVCWPWVQRLGFGRLPGDIVIEEENYRLYFPITTMIVVSIVITIIVWLLRK